MAQPEAFHAFKAKMNVIVYLVHEPPSRTPMLETGEKFQP